MELLQLKYFCDAAETENFSLTADKFFVPTSGVSQSIKRLEKELECELFDRKANKIKLNSNGRRFYFNVSKALKLIDTGKSELLDLGGVLNGDISLICLNNRSLVTAAIEEFIKKNPNVNFTIHHTLTENQDFDLLISDTSPFEYESRFLLVNDQICVAMSKNHPLAKVKPFSITQLEQERFITMTKDSSIHKITLDTCREAGFDPNIVIQSDDPFYVRKYIEMGLGIAFVPQNSWTGMFSDDIVLKKVGRLKRKTYAYLPKTKYIKSSVQKFIEVLLNLSPDGPGI